MDVIAIQGGKALNGTVATSGASSICSARTGAPVLLAARAHFIILRRASRIVLPTAREKAEHGQRREYECLAMASAHMPRCVARGDAWVKLR